MESAAAKTRELRDRLIRRIKEIPDSYIHGSLEKRLPGNINCSFAGVEGEAVVIMLDLAGVCARRLVPPAHRGPGNRATY